MPNLHRVDLTIHALARSVQNLPLPNGNSNPPAPPRRYKSSDSVLLAKQLAFGVFANRRHFESHLHGLYSQIFSDLTHDYSNLTPVINYKLYLQMDGTTVVEVPGKGHADDPQSLREEAVSDVFEDSGNDDEVDAVHDSQTSSSYAASESDNVSSKSSKSIHGRYTEVCPDLVVLHSRWTRMFPVLLTARPSRQQLIPYFHRHGVQPKHVCAAIIGEFKSGPSRGLDLNVETLAKFKELQSIGFDAAQQQVAKYIAIFFASHPHISRVLAFVACGVCWQYAFVTRNDLAEYDPCENEFLQDDINMRILDTFGVIFSRTYEVGTQASDRKFSRLRRNYLHPLGCDGYLKPQ